MNFETRTLTCLCTGRIFYDLKNVLPQCLNWDEYHIESFDDNNDFLVDLFVSHSKKVRIIVTEKLKDSIDVCLLGCWAETSFNFLKERMKINAAICREAYPTSPYILAAHNAGTKNDPSVIRAAEIQGFKLMNQKMGDALAREIEAIKFIECSDRSGRGWKILVDEIAIAGLGKLKDEKEQKKANKRCDIF